VGLLLASASSDLESGAYILPRMLARTPDNARVYRQYLQLAQVRGDAALLDELERHAEVYFGEAGRN
jgi:hypothetical protein